MGMKKRQSEQETTITIGGVELDKERLIQECEEALDKLLEEQLEEGSDFATYETSLLKLVHEIARRKLKKTANDRRWFLGSCVDRTLERLAWLAGRYDVPVSASLSKHGYLP